MTTTFLVPQLPIKSWKPAKTTQTLCCVSRTPHPRATGRFQPLRFSKRATELSHELRSSGILGEDDTKLFETFTDSRAERFIRVLNNRTRHVTFVLDGVHGAHNLAAIARSCDAWGVQDLHLIAQRAGQEGGNSQKERFSSLVERFEKEKSVQNVSKNSHKWLSIQEHAFVTSCLTELKKAGYRVLVSSLSPTAAPIQEVDVSKKTAFVFGNEREGVSKEMESHADGLFTIPMMGFVESMNVSVAVGTTASVTMTKCRTTIPEAMYSLSIYEKRELAHAWLKTRFSAKGIPKTLPSSQDVTRLGSRCERRILECGMFDIAEGMFDPEHPNLTPVRLSVDAGARLATYITRRKFGALGDGHFEKRCDRITYCLAGAHTLSCGAALARYVSQQIPRPKLFRYFKKVCDSITELYSPYFDEAGIPILPTFAPESRQTFGNLSKTAAQRALPVCVEFAKEHFGLDGSAVSDIIERACYMDLSQCVTDTLGWSKESSEIFRAEVTRSMPRTVDLIHLLQERESVRTLAHRSPNEISTMQPLQLLPEESLAALQVFLRLSHAAFLSSEIHQAVWDRTATKNHLARVHSLRFGLLESILCEAWAESVTVTSLASLGPLRLVLECDQALVALKHALTHDETARIPLSTRQRQREGEYGMSHFPRADRNRGG